MDAVRFGAHEVCLNVKINIFLDNYLRLSGIVLPLHHQETQKHREMTTQEKIQNELGQKIKNIRFFERFWLFEAEDGRLYSNKLTKTGKHKKNSVRLHP